jgi:hypothetical protein
LTIAFLNHRNHSITPANDPKTKANVVTEYDGSSINAKNSPRFTKWALEPGGTQTEQPGSARTSAGMFVVFPSAIDGEFTRGHNIFDSKTNLTPLSWFLFFFSIIAIKHGSLMNAYLNLSRALTAMEKAMLAFHHHQQQTYHVDQGNSPGTAYAYSWVKCSDETILSQLSPEANAGFVPYMCLRFLRIEQDTDGDCAELADSATRLVPCPFCWAIHYK